MFSPVYSAYDGEHTFAVPVPVERYSDLRHQVSWGTDSPDLVDLEVIDATTVRLTSRGAGTARIIARAGPLSGATQLFITPSTPEEWKTGQALQLNKSSGR